MFHKLKKDVAHAEAGEHIEVAKNQVDYLVKKGVIEKEGHEKDPSVKEPKKTEAKVSTTSSIADDNKVIKD